MNGLKVFLLSFVLLFVLGAVALAQETPPAEEPSGVGAGYSPLIDENIQPEDLGVSEPRLLPDSPFYFLKNWSREIRSFLVFNPVRQAELRMKFANEKLMEAKKLIELKKDPEIIKKATENYQQEVERIKNQAEKIKDKARENPQVESFLEKFIHQQTLHQKLLDRLETQVPPQAFEKIKEARERHLERFKDVMLKLEDRREKIGEKLEKVLEKQKGSEFKEFKNLEILKRIEEVMPEEVKEKIREAQENNLKRLEKKLEEMPAEKQEQLKEYIEKISGEKERHLEILENLRQDIQTPAVPLPPSKLLELKEKLEEGKEKMIEKIEEKSERSNCPLWTIPTPGFCKEGRVIVEKDPKTGCPLPPRCIIPGEQTIAPTTPEPIEKGREATVTCCVGTECRRVKETVCLKNRGRIINAPRCDPGICEQRRTEVPIEACITLWDPVCGKDGKTYSNECFAKLAGVEMDYKGVCKEAVPVQPLPPEKLPTLPE